MKLFKLFSSLKNDRSYLDIDKMKESIDSNRDRILKRQEEIREDVRKTEEEIERGIRPTGKKFRL